MHVYLITDVGIERRPPDELKQLLEEPDTFVWVDLPVCQLEEADVLSQLFGFRCCSRPSRESAGSELTDTSAPAVWDSTWACLFLHRAIGHISWAHGEIVAEA
jgi:hypothetical protein